MKKIYQQALERLDRLSLAAFAGDPEAHKALLNIARAAVTLGSNAEYLAGSFKGSGVWGVVQTRLDPAIKAVSELRLDQPFGISGPATASPPAEPPQLPQFGQPDGGTEFCRRTPEEGSPPSSPGFRMR